jgi:glycosyltransferase involved in cell wall biosynthesis
LPRKNGAMRPQISVVIPTYNAAQWLEATLGSVLSQSIGTERLEIIVVDDRSTDGSPELARTLLARHPGPHQVIVRERNGGAGAARNSGWRSASADWIQFLDADDLLAERKLELQASYAATAPEEVAVVYSNWQYFGLEHDQWQPIGPINAPVVDDDPILQILEEFDFGYVGPALIRKSFVERIGGFHERPNIGEDCELMLRIALAGGHFRQVRADTAMFLYRQSPGSVWRRWITNPAPMRNLLLGFRELESELRKRNPEGRLSDRTRAALAKRYSRFADLYFENDKESFRNLMGWLGALGYARPTTLTSRFAKLSDVIGYENALRLRSAYRTKVEPLRRALFRAAPHG